MLHAIQAPVANFVFWPYQEECLSGIGLSNGDGSYFDSLPCSLQPSTGRLVAEVLECWMLSRPRWVNLWYGRIKGYVCLRSEYGISKGLVTFRPRICSLRTSREPLVAQQGHLGFVCHPNSGG
jgi:hypothetical protein